MYKTIYCSLIALILTGCLADAPKMRELASTEMVQKSIEFKKHDKYANVYFLRKFTPGMNFTSYILTVGGQQAGYVNNNQYVNFKVAPGEHNFIVKEISTQYPNVPQYNGEFANFNLSLKAGSIAFISCGHHIPRFWTDEERYLLSSEKCSDNTKVSKNGITSCSKRFLVKGKREWDGVHYIPEDTMNCKLTSNSNTFLSNANRVMVKSDIDIVKNREEEDFKTAKYYNTLIAYETFLQQYPKGEHYSEVKKLKSVLDNKQDKTDYQTALTNNTISGYKKYITNHGSGKYIKTVKAKIKYMRHEGKIQEVLDRYASLPKSVQKDKVTILLANYLKKEQFNKSLLYFNVLDRMNVEVDPSFSYFWGEALLKTGSNKKGLKKLYDYIAKEGSSAQYYIQALQLTTEVEEGL